MMTMMTMMMTMTMMMMVISTMNTSTMMVDAFLSPSCSTNEIGRRDVNMVFPPPTPPPPRSGQMKKIESLLLSQLQQKQHENDIDVDINTDTHTNTNTNTDTSTNSNSRYRYRFNQRQQQQQLSQQPRPQWINGRRVLLVPSRNPINQNDVDMAEGDLSIHEHDDDDDDDDDGNNNNNDCNDDNNNNDNDKRQKLLPQPLPPIVILGGMAQSISSWEHHLPTFARERDVLVYEYVGSGLGYRDVEFHEYYYNNRDSMNNSYDNSNVVDSDSYYISEQEYYQNVTLTQQAQEFKTIVQKIFPKCTTFDIIGFSLGARIALKTIASYPTLIRKAHLTGVGLKRSPYAKIIICSWKDILQSGVERTTTTTTTATATATKTVRTIDTKSDESNSVVNSKLQLSASSLSSLKAFAWSIIIATYSPDFLALSGADKVASWVNHITASNNPIGLLKLLEQTHGDALQKGDGRDIIVSSLPSSSSNNDEMDKIVQQIRTNHLELSKNEPTAKDKVTKVQLHVGKMDQISTIDEAHKLYSLIGDSDDNGEEAGIVVYEQCSHAIMNEDGRQWRRNALDFLNGI